MIDSSDPSDPSLWQDQEGWHVKDDISGRTAVFQTKEEAIAWSAAIVVDGMSAARAETGRGDQPLPADAEDP